MDELRILTEVKKTVLPNGWLTATECRKMAENWKDEELTSCIDIIMNVISYEASRGNNSAWVNIRTNKPKHFYTALEEKMKLLGYDIGIPKYSGTNTPAAALWVFKW